MATSWKPSKEAVRQEEKHVTLCTVGTRSWLTQRKAHDRCDVLGTSFETDRSDASFKLLMHREDTLTRVSGEEKERER